MGVRLPRFLGLAWALVACGSSGGGSRGYLALPQVVYQGGGLLSAPKIVNVTFSGYSLAPELQTFGEAIPASAWWNTVRADYCEGSGGACGGDGSSTMVELTTTAEVMYTDSAEGFGGYHNIWQSSSSETVPYAVIAECAPLTPPFPNITTNTLLEDTTIDASHEILEAVTDPNPPTGYALDGTNPDNWGWIDVTGGGEAADMCVDLLGLNQDQTTDGSFTVQRTWSNSRALASLEPCNPAPAGDVYFNAAPSQAFFVLDVGASATFDVQAFSFGAMKDWTLLAQDWSDSATAT